MKNEESDKSHELRSLVDKLSVELTDKGRIIEGGWIALQAVALPADASRIQVSEMRKAFFAGAQHLYASIMSILEPGAEPTDKDLDRMILIDKELREFVRELKEDMFT